MQFSYNLVCTQKGDYQMENNKYVKLHSLLRMAAALLAIAVFISMFVAKQMVNDDFSKVFVDFSNGAFFGDEVYDKGNVFAFVAYILVIVGGLAGLAFVFIDELIGKDLTKKLSFVVGAVLVVAGIVIALFSPVFKALNDLPSSFHTAASPIVFGCLAAFAGACNCAAPILEDKGY